MLRILRYNIIMFAHPKKIIAEFPCSFGSVVVDFGAGSGHFIPFLSQKVGQSGKVLAIDIQKELLQSLKKEAVRLSLRNVEVIWSDLERSRGSRLADAVVDGVLIANLFPYISDKQVIPKEAGRILKPGGYALIIERLNNTEFGGNKENIQEVDVQELFSQYGFTIQKKVDAGLYHYGILIRKV